MAYSQTTPTRSPVWVFLTGSIALVILASQFLPTSTSDPVSTILASYSAMLWTGVFGFALYRYLQRRAWVGFAIGSLIGFTINQLAVWL